MKFIVGLILSAALPFNLWALDASAKKLVIIGDSVTEGYGVSRDAAYPSLLQKKLEKAGKNWRVINSGISGSTSASSLSRITWHMKQKPDLIILALGGNDGLRGNDVKTMEANLTAGIEFAKKSGVKIILAGIRMPPNYGATYTSEFDGAFARVAGKTGVPLIPFILDKVGGDQKLNLEDGIHPNEKGHAIIADTVFKAVEKFL